MNKAVRFLIICVLTVAAGVSPAFPADSIGKANNIFDIATGQSARTKLHDNGDGTFSLQLALVTLGGSDHVGKANDIFDINSGTNALITLVDNLDGTFSPLVSCPDCGGGGGGGNIEDTAYNSTTWNGDTDGASKNALRDFFVLFDPDGDGKVSVLDVGAGIPKTDASGNVSLATSGADYAPATSGSAILKGNGSGGFSAAVSGTDYGAAPNEQTVGDANATWTNGKTLLRASAAITANRVETLPAANAYSAGSIIAYVDRLTGTSSTFTRSFNAAGSDTVNGGASYAPAAGPGSSAFETDGSSAWTVVFTSTQPAFTDMRDKLTDDQAALLVKPSSTLVAASNLTLSGNQTIDGVTGTNGQTIVLATAQSTGSQNGPWVMQSSSWTRPAWYSSGSTVQAQPFMTTFIRLGTTYTGSTWRCTTTGTITIDTTSTTWTQTPVSLASSNLSGTLGLTNLSQAIAPTWTGPHIFNGGGASQAALRIGSATLATSPVGGDFGSYDGKVHYSTHATGERGVLVSRQWIQLTSSYTLTSQTAVQKLFNATTNGRITLAGNTSYDFVCRFALTGLSSSSGSYGFAFGGTATITEQTWKADAAKSTALTTAANLQSTWNTAANTSISNANTNTTGVAEIKGTLRISTGGTIIPQVSLTVAAAAVVQSGAIFEIWPSGSDTATSVGNWD